MALYYQLSTQNVLTKFLSVSSITGGNSVNAPQLASTVAALLQTPNIPQNLSTTNLFVSSITASSITANNVDSAVFSSLQVFTSSLVGVATGGLASLPSTISTFSLLTSSIQFSSITGSIISTQQLFASSIVANQLFTSTATISTISTNTINFAGGFGYLTLPDIYPNTVFTSTLTTSNILLGLSSQISPLQFYGFGTYSNSVIAELSTGATTQELIMFRGSNASDRIRMQTTGNIVFESGVSARLWPTAGSNFIPSMIINTASNVGIQTSSPTTTLDVLGTGKFNTVSTQTLIASTFITANALISTTATISSLTVNSLQFGDGTGWVSLGPLQTVAISTTQINTNLLYASNTFLGIQSSVTGLQFFGLQGNYNNTVLAEVSTGVGIQELLVFKGSSTSDRIRLQTTGNFVVETGVSARLWSTTTLNTLSNATPAFIINTSSNVGIQTASPGATLDVAGTGRFQLVSTLNINLSTINGQVFGAPINSSIIGLGSAGYVSSSQLLSTIDGLGQLFVSSPSLISTVAGLGQIYLSTGGAGTGDVTTAQLRSTVGGLGQIYLSTATGASGPVPFISAFTVSTGSLNVSSLNAMTANITSSATVSSMTTNAITIGASAGWLLTSPIQTVAVSTNTFYADQSYVNTETATTGIISTITTNSLTLGSGSSWILAGPLQTSLISSIYMWANTPYFDTVNVGSVSTMNSLEYAGLFNNYNNTVLAEISTGGGTQEFLIFKGSSASDRVRVQTTGNFVVETGVSARLFNSNTTQTLSNATPAFIINSSSNVGIQTASPGATLDVAGSGRFLTLSSLQVFTSSIVAPYTFQPQYFTF